MQTRFVCPHCGEEIFLWEAGSLHGLPILCPHCAHGVLAGVAGRADEAFIVYSKPTTIVWLAVRWLTVGGFSLILLACAFAVLLVDSDLSLPSRIAASVLLLLAAAFFLHIAIYGRLRERSQLEYDRKAHRVRIRSLGRRQ